MHMSHSIARRLCSTIMLLLGFFFIAVVGIATVLELFHIDRDIRRELKQKANYALGLIDLTLALQQSAVSHTAINILSLTSCINFNNHPSYVQNELVNLSQDSSIDQVVAFDYLGRFISSHNNLKPSWYTSSLVEDMLEDGHGMIIFSAGYFFILEPIRYININQGGIIARINIKYLVNQALKNIEGFYTLSIDQKWLFPKEADQVTQDVHAFVVPKKTLLLSHFDTRLSSSQSSMEYIDRISPWLIRISLFGLFSLLLMITPARKIGKSLVHPIESLIKKVNTRSYPITPFNTGDELEVLAKAFDDATDRLHEANKELILSEYRSGQNQLHSIIDIVRDGIITIDKHGTIETFNLAAENIFGYHAYDVVGNNVTMLMPVSYAKDHNSYLKNYIPCNKSKVIGVDREVIGRRKDGSEFPVYLSVSEINILGNRIFTGVLREIPQRKRNEKLKIEFISLISHELRTPLTSIRGALGLVMGRFNDELSPKCQQILNMALRNCDRLTLLINDILDMDKFESGKLSYDFKLSNLNTLVSKSVEDNEGFACMHDVKLILRSFVHDAEIIADYNRLQQVMANLLSNAIKYSPKGSCVTINLNMDRQYYRVEITDCGPGIPPEFHDRIFQRFAQANNSDTLRVGGTGLGLNITKAIIDSHHGEIGFHSVVGSGCTFFFILPVM